jgi:glycosyltransferase involved in cell wall biosynthesis
MAYGRPVVATRVGGLADLEQGADLVEPADVAALRGAVVRRLADWAPLGAAGRAHARARLSPSAVGDDLAAAYGRSV